MAIPGLRPVTPGAATPRDDESEAARRARRDPAPDPRGPKGAAADVPEVDASGRVAPPEPPPSRIRGLRRADSDQPASFSERAGAVGQGVRSAIGASAPFVAGLAAGTAATPTGPAGMALAGATAFEATRQATKRVAANVPPIEDIDPDLRPFRVAGEVLGAGSPVSAAPAAVTAAAGKVGQRVAPVIEEAGGPIWKRIGRFIQRQGREVKRTAQETPGTMLAAEGSALGGAAAGGGIAEAADPGDDTSRVIGEVVGGFASPASLLISGASSATEAATRLASGRSQAGLERMASKELSRTAEQLGEDPAQITRGIRDEMQRTSAEGGLGASRTVGQMVDSPTMQALEATLVQRSSQFGSESREAAQKALEDYRGAISALESSGDPAALREAAQLRDRYFRDLLESTAATAQRRVAEVGQRMAPDEGSLDPSRLSARADAIVSESLGKAREAERELWSKVPFETSAEAPNTLSRITQVTQEELLPGESLPPVVTSFSNLIRNSKEGAEGSVPLRRLQQFRSRMLSKAREADSNFQADEARLYGRMAEAALDDMLAVDAPGLEDARAYSRALNDVFTRTFAGQTASTGRGGASRLPPEILLRRSVSGGKELAALRTQELERAVRFGDPEAADELLSIQEQFLRNAAQETIDPESGVVSPGRLATFRRNNKAVLERFPELRDDLQNLSSARTLLDDVRSRVSGAEKAIRERAAFAKAADAENTTRFVGKILAGERPQEGIRQLAAVAKREGPDAVAGLRRAVLDDAYERAGGTTEMFSFSTFDRVLNKPRRAGQPSTLQMLRRSGVLDEEQTKRMQQLLDRAEQVERGMSSQGGIDNLLEAENAVSDFVLRFTGAGIGAGMSAAAGGGAQSLVAAGAGSRFMRSVFDKVPRGRVQDVLIEAAQNPGLMASLLEQAPTPKQKVALARRIHGYLWAAGLTESPEGEGASGQDGEDE